MGKVSLTLRGGERYLDSGFYLFKVSKSCHRQVNLSSFYRKGRVCLLRKSNKSNNNLESVY